MGVVQSMLQLRVKLSVVDGRGAVDGTLHLHADEAATAAQVCQQVQSVARADERGNAGQGLGIPLVGTADAQALHLHQVLQLGQTGSWQAVELININQTAGG